MDVLAPTGWDGTASFGADGSGWGLVAPAGEVLPPHGSNALPAGSTDEAVVATHNGGCQGCADHQACPDFAAAAQASPRPARARRPLTSQSGCAQLRMSPSRVITAFAGYPPPDGSAVTDGPGWIPTTVRMPEEPASTASACWRTSGKWSSTASSPPHTEIHGRQIRQLCWVRDPVLRSAPPTPEEDRLNVCCKQPLDSLACTGLRRLGTRARLEKK